MARNPRREDNTPKERPEFEEVVVQVDRVTRVVKGGRRMRFRALVVVSGTVISAFLAAIVAF